MPIARLVDPLFVLLVVAGLGLALSGGGWTYRARRAKVGRALAWSAWLALWLLSMPWVSSGLVRRMSTQPRDLRAELAGSSPERRVLVILTAGIDADEFGTPAMERQSANGIERGLGAARVYRTYGFGHVIVSGQDVRLERTELAGAMADLLVELGVPRKKILLETESRDTRENAIYSAKIARSLSAEAVVVVTSALHMPRSIRMFERAGLDVLPAPIRFEALPHKGPGQLIPSSLTLRRSHRAVHELVGLLEP
ncbi:YdcF family protein [Sorangium sp. So ce1014]|uniref:YdcF family protein n=1 Tax=Sorangium sp. So ce1014 TaxID=3133326 RepID=UPI003F5F0F7A